MLVRRQLGLMLFAGPKRRLRSGAPPQAGWVRVLVLLAAAGFWSTSAYGEAGPGGVIHARLRPIIPAAPSFPLGILDPQGISLPGVSVYLRNRTNGAETVRVVSNLDGEFVIPAQPAGDYGVCWEASAGFEPGCTDSSMGFPPFITVVDKIATFDFGTSRPVDAYLEYSPAADRFTIDGRVAFEDGSRCEYRDRFFGIELTATVKLLDATTGSVVAGPVRTNPDGTYLLPNVPAGNYRLRATCEQSVAEQALSTGADNWITVDLKLPAGNPPVITTLAAFVGAQAIKGAPPSTVLTVMATAHDDDPSDQLHFAWLATDGNLTSRDSSTVRWRLPSARARGLHFLYVMVRDDHGGYATKRVAVSTDAGVVPAAPGAPSSPLPSDEFAEPERYLAAKGLDTRTSACQYYKAIRALRDCDAHGNPHGTLTFGRWKKAHGFKKGATEYQAAFRNVADLNLVREHHATNAADGDVAYYVCNHAQSTGALPDGNLVACVAMDYSAVRGVNDNKPFTKYLTFGPSGKLLLSVSLDGRGEKFMPGTCVACHGGDGYHGHFPEQGVTQRDANIGAYFLPFDLDNYEYATQPGFTRDDQEDSLRQLNLLLMETEPTPVAQQLIDGWYPGGAGKQNSEFVPPGWMPTVDGTVPAFAPDLYLETVKPYCRLCHVAMGSVMKLDFNRYQVLSSDDPSTPADDTKGGFVGDEFFFPIGSDTNADHTFHRACQSQGILGHHWNYSMPNALQTFNRFWADPSALQLLSRFLAHENIHQEDPDTCGTPPPSPFWGDWNDVNLSSSDFFGDTSYIGQLGTAVTVWPSAVTGWATELHGTVSGSVISLPTTPIGPLTGTLQGDIIQWSDGTIWARTQHMPYE